VTPPIKSFGGAREGSIGRTSPKKMTVKHAFEVIRAMGKFLQAENPAPGCIADEKKLPFPKQHIRGAIVLALESRPPGALRELLKHLFLEIAYWQSDIGERDIGIDHAAVNGASRATTEAADDPARKIVVENNGVERWQKAIEDERSQAKSALERRGLW